jgi:hypothetical protein
MLSLHGPSAISTTPGKLISTTAQHSRLRMAGQLVENISSQLLAPASFSAVN